MKTQAEDQKFDFDNFGKPEPPLDFDHFGPAVPPPNETQTL